MDLGERPVPYRQPRTITHAPSSKARYGPDTSSQLIALQHLQSLADLQRVHSRPDFPPSGPLPATVKAPAPHGQRDSFLRRHGARFTSFAVIGRGILVTGPLIQAGLTSGLHACANSSAEVITEDPGGAVTAGVNLADFGMANFTATRVTTLSGVNGTHTAGADWTSSVLEMADSSLTVLATPPGRYGGRSFNTTWYSAT